MDSHGDNDGGNGMLLVLFRNVKFIDNSVTPIYATYIE